jgi:hypothetical protein
LSFCIPAGKIRDSEAPGPPKKKRKKAQKKSREQEQKAAKHKAKSLEEKSPAACGVKKPAAAKEKEASSSTVSPAGEGLQGMWSHGWDTNGVPPFTRVSTGRHRETRVPIEPRSQ